MNQLEQYTIACRCEGGIGDVLLQNRFVHAIREKYPDAKLNIYFDTDENPKQQALLQSIWPTLYKNSITVPKRQSTDFKIKSQFGVETYNAALENQSQEALSLYKHADKFYNLCLDNLDWVNSDIDWWRYFYFFPKPEIVQQFNLNLPEQFIFANLYSRPDSSFKLEKWYVEALIQKLAVKYPVIITTTKENKSFYDFCSDIQNVQVLVTDLNETFYIASKCSAFIGLDSGIRCMPYYFGKPTFYFSTFCKTYGQISKAHLLRWVIFENQALPMHLDINNVNNILINSIEHRVGVLFPLISPSDMDNIIVKRKYSV
jgi:ADP-heptose:LPS heptosyltransferase